MNLLPLAAMALLAARADSSGPDSARVYRMPEVRVTADRWVPERNVLPLATTTIARAAIEASGALSAGEILRPVVGIRVASLGGVGSFTPISIRGSSNDQVVILVDGRRLNTAQGGGVDLSDIPLEGIERIEVARGGASALYGPDAIGGAINLISRQAAAGRFLRLKGEVGSFGTRAASGGAGGSGERLSWKLNGRVLDSKGNYTFVDDGAVARRENGSVTSRSADGGLDWRTGSGSRLELRASHYHAVKGIPGATEFPSATATQRDERSAVDFEIPAVPAFGVPLLGGPRAFTRVAVFAQRQIRGYEDPDYALGAIDDSHRNDAFGGTVEQKRDVASLGTAILGFEFREDHLESSTDGRRKRPARAVYARQILNGRRGAWSLVPAIRVDQVSRFDPAWSPRLLGSVRTGAVVEFRGSVGRAFRPPSFDDLFFPARASAAGNPGLRPERSTDADFGVALRGTRWTAGLTAFHSRVRDLIQWQPGAGGVWRPHNVPGARLAGFEAEVQGNVALPFTDTAWFSANYTFLVPIEAGNAPNTGGKDLVYRPRHRANLEIRVPRGPWTVETGWRYTGPVFTTRANTKSLPGYVVGDVGLFRRLSGATVLELRALNVTEATYEDIRDYPVPGRQWRLAVVFRSGAGS